MKIYFFETASGNSPIKKFIDRLPEEAQARFLEVIQEVQNNGFAATAVTFKPIEGKLWEIKFRSLRSGFRVFYVLVEKEIMVWLHVFNKKSQKTPIKELKIARKRLKEVLS